jgi:putative transposase
MLRTAYPTDLSDRQWLLIQPFLPASAHLGRKRSTDLREVANAILYVLRSGGAWRLLPHDFPPWQTVYRYFRAWLTAGIWERIHTTLREKLREKVGRQVTPSAGILDSQSVKITCQKGFRGYDGAKKVNGRKRHALVDTQGLLLKVVVSPANVRDTDGAEVLFERIKGHFPRLQHIWVDGGYQGPFIKQMRKRFKITVEVVKHAWSEMKRGVWLPADAEPPVIPTGFHVLLRRWVVERTFAWWGFYRRLSKDYEQLPFVSEGLIQLAMIDLMVKRLARYEQE